MKQVNKFVLKIENILKHPGNDCNDDMMEWCRKTCETTNGRLVDVLRYICNEHLNRKNKNNYFKKK